MTRRVVEHRGVSVDREPLTIIQIYEESVNKETIRKEVPWTKRHAVLVKRNGRFEFK